VINRHTNLVTLFDQYVTRIDCIGLLHKVRYMTEFQPDFMSATVWLLA